MRHSPETIHQFIDLIGFTKEEAVEITQRRIQITQKALATGECKPNTGNNEDHIYKVIAHRGKHSANGQGVLKFAMKEWLETWGFDHYQNMVDGIFLVRLRSSD